MSDEHHPFESNPDKEAELQRERRRQRAIERLGNDNPACAACGENDPLTLELHHVAGRAFDAATVILCRNCHRKLSDAQKDHPNRISEPPDPLESVGHFLHGLAEMFELIVQKLREFAAQLIERADENGANVEPPAP